MSSKYQFKLPDVGEGMAEGTIGEWHVQVGDQVKQDEDFVQIENDKSVEEIPAPIDGVVTKIIVPEGELANVGDPLIELEVADGQGNMDDAAPVAEPAEDPEPAPAPEIASEPGPVAIPVTSVPVANHDVPVLAMPAVRKFAREQGVDLTQVTGTGRHGQILKVDVEAFKQGDQAVASVATGTETATPAPSPVVPAAAEGWPEHAEKMSPVRKQRPKR